MRRDAVVTSVTTLILRKVFESDDTLEMVSGQHRRRANARYIRLTWANTIGSERQGYRGWDALYCILCVHLLHDMGNNLGMTPFQSRLSHPDCSSKPLIDSSSPVHDYFPAREWAVRLPAFLLVVGLTAIGLFVGLTIVKENRKKAQKGRLRTA